VVSVVIETQSIECGMIRLVRATGGRMNGQHPLSPLGEQAEMSPSGNIGPC